MNYPFEGLLRPSTVLENRYRILGLLGQGGMSRVYFADDQRLGIRVAIKENLQTTAEARAQFEREARLLASLSHPNLPRVNDHFNDPQSGLHYLVMDYIEGQDLDAMIKRVGPLPEAMALAWIEQILWAVEYLHAQHPPIIHRDIKPANIKITPQGKAVLVDFGIAKSYDPRIATLTGARAVTPGYAPPEQYGMRTDERSDIYALGATLYTMLTGRVPPEAPLRMSSVERMIPPRKLALTISSKTEAAVERAMEIDTTKRWQRVAQMREVVEGRGSHAGAPRHDAALTRGVITPAFKSSAQVGTPVHKGARGNARNISRFWWVAGGATAFMIAAVVLLALFLFVLRTPNGSSPTPAVQVAAGETLPVSQPAPTSAATLEPRTQTSVPATTAPTRTRSSTNTPTRTPLPTPVPTAVPSPSPPMLVAASMAGVDWPMFGHDVARTGWNSAEKSLHPPLKLLWSQTISGYYIDYVSIAGGSVFLGGMDSDHKNRAFALSTEEGQTQWSFQLTGGGGGAMDVTPTFLNGLVFFGGQDDDQLYGLDASTGKPAWTVRNMKDMYASQPLAVGSTVYVHGGNQYYAVDSSSGTVLWTQKGEGHGSPSVMGDGIVYTRDTNGTLIAYDIRAGKTIWHRPEIRLPHFTGMVYDAISQVIYLQISNTEIAAVKAADGSVVWKTTLPVFGGGQLQAQMSLAERTLLVTVWKSAKGTGTLYALDAATGAQRWNFDTGQEGVRVPSIANTVAYFCGWKSQSVYAVDIANGQLLWRYSLKGYGGLTVVARGRLFVASGDTLYAFGGQ